MKRFLNSLPEVFSDPAPACIIVGAGELGDYRIEIQKDDLVIAADGGYRTVCERSLCVDLVLGDFDSLGEIPSGERVSVHPVKKDLTDTALAVKEGLSRGFSQFYIYGCLGGRPDHGFANLQLLLDLAKQGKRAILFGEIQNVTAVCDGCFTLQGERGATFSLFAADTYVSEVSIEGALYPLSCQPLSNHFPLGVSNQMAGERVRGNVKGGTVLVFFDKNLKFS